MTIRRPDQRTHRQRLAKCSTTAALVESIGRMSRQRQEDIRQVYVAEVRKGSRCKVLVPW